MYIPDRRADLGGLAKQEAQFLEGLGEGVFSRHCRRRCGRIVEEARQPARKKRESIRESSCVVLPGRVCRRESDGWAFWREGNRRLLRATHP